MKVYKLKIGTGSFKYLRTPSDISSMEVCWIRNSRGNKLPFDFTGSFAEDIVIPKGQYLERNIWWSVVHTN